MTTVRLTMSQALTRWMTAQSIEQLDGSTAPAFAGVWAIFGHGNVAGLGEALYGVRDELPTYRGHNEQSMAHIAIAYAKQMQRRRMMAVTTSIGPGATNLATAAALAHVNRLPVLLLPGDVFATRRLIPFCNRLKVLLTGWFRQMTACGRSRAILTGSPALNSCFRPCRKPCQCLPILLIAVP